LKKPHFIDKKIIYGQVSPTENAKNSFAYPQPAPANKYIYNRAHTALTILIILLFINILEQLLLRFI